ncbi:recombinase RecT [Neptunomonas marina]|nr:recombinase RecT [Neptunomonas marina]
MSNVATISQQTTPQKSPFAVMASRLNIDEQETRSLMTNTLMKAKNNGQVSDGELITFLAIANEYRLNPLTKEIYAFNNRGAIQPIVSIDGWLKIINEHTQFDGMEFSDSLDANGALSAITCRIYRKDRQRPTEVTEYLDECKGTSEPWKKWPARMLRHKATIQAARYAFGLSGIIDEDEAERYRQTTLVSEREVNPAANQSSLKSRVGNSSKAEAQSASLGSQKQSMPSFDQPPPVDQLLKELQVCTTKEDLDQWKAAATQWPEGSAERTSLIQSYKDHCSNLSHAAQNQEQ